MKPHVEAGQYVAVHQLPTTPVEWCAFYGVTVADGVAIVYKGVRDDYRSAHGFLYSPGTVVEAPDWDGGVRECGGGLHFSPHPAMTTEFDAQITRWMACPVALEHMRPPRQDDDYPQKIKARRTYGPVYEVDYRGQRRVTSPGLAGNSA